MAFLGRRGSKSAPRQQPSATRCGCGRGIPAGRGLCGSCAREGSKGNAVATTGPCQALIYRDGRRQACGGAMKSGVCPSSDH